MANGSGTPQGNGHAAGPAPLDASRTTVTLAASLKPVPPAEELVFGKIATDHMAIAHYDPVNGWSAPEIKPYGPLMLDPLSSCLQYSTSLFEGMKAYLGADDKVRLFRPEMNMARMDRSRERIALPPVDFNEVLKIIKRFVKLEERWIPRVQGHSLYIRPTLIGTRASLGVGASDHATLYVICSPTGPYFRVARPLSLKAVGDYVRSWPGGTGGYKLSLNYAPTFHPQTVANKEGYDQILWLLGDKITEAGAMNFFAVLMRDDGDWDVVTPSVDGTILPGVTRHSCLELTGAHGSEISLYGLPSNLKLHPQERDITFTELEEASASGKLLEVFVVGTAVVVASVEKIGADGKKDIVLQRYEGSFGPVARGLYEKITGIQEGREQFRDWSVVCE
ncbi:branched-chain amino acid aminotransferase II [Irpex rosettiformis]|uniref:Branched-chain amino acid aminotransferase II n=1 Tax=Irpex rosettiformis TaxID=378272 RepID=A0ACB8TUN2_9APHY|nr:branched-chain amino acid aminotransferase II [Irpex rosettiformis]